MNKNEAILSKIYTTGIIPVVKLDSIEEAVPLAKALLAGGISVIEVTFRSESASEGIKAIKQQCPEMLVGAGTVINVTLAEKAIEAGAEFIVSPGFNPSVVTFCKTQKMIIIPGVSTPSDIEKALEMDISLLKFFPAEQSGGINMLKAFAGPFSNVKFIPTGGISKENVADYLVLPNVFAVGGTWMISKDRALVEKNSKEAILEGLGFSFGHIGINADNSSEATSIVKFLQLLNFTNDETPVSFFCHENKTLATPFEIMKAKGKGDNGHIGIKTTCIERALAYLEKLDIYPDMSTAMYLNDNDKFPLRFVYISSKIAGFAIHLSRK